ncbi:MAG: response regulator transcription factor [Lachnospiraceae bacterium]|nr:response regulator transcription factor [Lachnospiraceae bacterium]
MKKILIAEDDTNINEMIRTSLTQAGYSCVSAYSGTEAALLFDHTERFDLVILDLMLPGLPGQDVLQELRKTSNIPVIVLSARDELDTKVDLLTLGANDYMTKPFSLKKLETRVMVQLRNTDSHTEENHDLTYKDLRLDKSKKQFSVCDIPVPLTAHELGIMELFLRYPERVFSKGEIYESAWEDYYMGEDKTINVHISNIRAKIKKITDQEYIETIWGLGFRLK